MFFVMMGILIVFIFFGFGAFFLNTEKKKEFRIYISGPMSGYDYYNFPAFNYMESVILADFNYIKVVNPAVISKKIKTLNPGASYEDYLREDFRALIDCDAVLLLDGWKESGGCIKEITVANCLKIPCFETYEEFKKFVETKRWM